MKTYTAEPPIGSNERPHLTPPDFADCLCALLDDDPDEALSVTQAIDLMRSEYGWHFYSDEEFVEYVEPMGFTVQDGFVFILEDE